MFRISKTSHAKANFDRNLLVWVQWFGLLDCAVNTWLVCFHNHTQGVQWLLLQFFCDTILSKYSEFIQCIIHRQQCLAPVFEGRSASHEKSLGGSLPQDRCLCFKGIFVTKIEIFPYNNYEICSQCRFRPGDEIFYRSLI